MERNKLPKYNGGQSRIYNQDSLRFWTLPRMIALMVLVIFGVPVATLAMDYFMATYFYGKIFGSIRSTWISDSVTEVIAILGTGLAMVLVPSILGRLVWSFWVPGNRPHGLPGLRKMRSSYGRTVLFTSFVWAACVAISYFFSQPAEGELFNPFTTAPRYKYYRDFDGEIKLERMGFLVNPRTQEPLALINQVVAKEYWSQQRNKAETFRREQENQQEQQKLQEELKRKQTELQKKEEEFRMEKDRLTPEVKPLVSNVVNLGPEKACLVFTGQDRDYALAKSGTGMRLWIKHAKFFPNKTVINFVVEPGAVGDEIVRSPRSSYLAAPYDAEAYKVNSFQTSLDFEERLRLSVDSERREYFVYIAKPTYFTEVYGPVVKSGELKLYYPSFQPYKFPIDNRGCPVQAVSAPAYKEATEALQDHQITRVSTIQTFVNYQYKPPVERQTGNVESLAGQYIETSTLCYNGSINHLAYDGQGNSAFVRSIARHSNGEYEFTVDVFGNPVHSSYHVQLYLAGVGTRLFRADRITEGNRGGWNSYSFSLKTDQKWYRFKLLFGDFTFDWQYLPACV